jgi:apolipoprotein N-acyltransferase
MPLGSSGTERVDGASPVTNGIQLTFSGKWWASLAALALGALSAAALPPLHLIPVLLLSVPGLLILIEAAPTAGQAVWRGFWFGFAHHVFGLYWITEAILIASDRYWWLVPLAVPALAVLLAVFIALPCALVWAVRPGWSRILVLAGCWVMADLAREFVLSGFPWNPWGSVWAIPGLVGDVFIQPAAWVGVPGLTLATIVLSGMPYAGLRASIGAALGVAAWGAIGLIRLSASDPAPAEVSVVLVQGSVAQHDKLDSASASAIFHRYLRLTMQGVAQAQGITTATKQSPQIVVIWPETASPYALQVAPAERAAIMQAASPAVAALVGSLRFTPDGLLGDKDNRPQNSLFALTGNGAMTDTYDKAHLVPFGEYAPSWIPLPIQVVPGGGFKPGPGPKTLHVPNLPSFGALICYEAIFPSEIVDDADRPGWLVNITNDAWFGNSAGPRQHLAAARLRAVEEGLPLMRAANTGISAGFDAHGRELGRLGVNEAGVLVVSLPGALSPTPFARWGLVLPGLAALTSVAFGLVLTWTATGALRGTQQSSNTRRR